MNEPKKPGQKKPRSDHRPGEDNPPTEMTLKKGGTESEENKDGRQFRKSR
ncbi:hypothetical protein [Barrientosiimonas humi]